MMDINFDFDSDWFQYVLFIILIIVFYYAFVKNKLFENFDLDTNINSAKNTGTSAVDSAKNSSSNAINGGEVVSIQDAEDIGSNLKTNATKIEDGLHLGKYRTQMENLIIDMNEWINAKTAEALPGIAKKMNNAGIESVLSAIKPINELQTFKTTLNTTMKYIDGR